MQEAGVTETTGVRERVLGTATRLFYAQGVRAVGIDLVVAEAAVAKTSLYRHFRTKDDLVAAFLQAEDADFWSTWDAATTEGGGDAMAELEAQLAWIAERVSRPGYRGCPQLNVAAEFPEPDHPARTVAVAHKAELRARLEAITTRLDVPEPRLLAGQLALLVDGAFARSPVAQVDDTGELLVGAARTLLAASGVSR